MPGFLTGEACICAAFSTNKADLLGLSLDSVSTLSRRAPYHVRVSVDYASKSVLLQLGVLLCTKILFNFFFFDEIRTTAQTNEFADSRAELVLYVASHTVSAERTRCICCAYSFDELFGNSLGVAAEAGFEIQVLVFGVLAEHTMFVVVFFYKLCT